MNKILVFSLMAILISSSISFAEEGMQEDKFKPMGFYKVRTNPIAEWMDNQVNKSYVQKKNTTTQQTPTNGGFSGYNQVKPQPQPKQVQASGGWSS